MRRKDAFDRDALHFAPFLLLPSPFPRQEFYRAVELQTLLNELMHKVAHDNDFLQETLSKTIAVDEFTGKLYEIHQQIQKEGGSAQVCPPRFNFPTSAAFLYAVFTTEQAERAP